MWRFIRWAALALFCAAWGFAGAFGAVWLSADRLEGPPGPVGEQGEGGPPGPVGATPDMTALATVLTRLESRLTDLESKELTSLFCGLDSVDVVSDVRVIPGFAPGNLEVSRKQICLE